MAALVSMFMVVAVCAVMTIFFGSQGVSSSDNRTRLHMSGEVEGYPTIIFCRVPFDIRSTKNHINIVKYNFDKPDEDPELYFQCNWPWSSSGSELNCSGRTGVRLGYAVGQVLQVQILNTSRKHEGRYECHHGLADKRDPGSGRELYVRGTNIGCNTQLISSADVTTKVLCHFNSDLTRTKDGFVLEWKELVGHTFHRVLTCTWYTSEVPWYQCFDGIPHHWITVSSIVKDKVIFNVPQKAHINKGQFLCDTIPEHSNVDVETCTIENPEPTSPSTTTLSKKSSTHRPPGLQTRQPTMYLTPRRSELESTQLTSTLPEPTSIFTTTLSKKSSSQRPPVGASAMPRLDMNVGVVLLLVMLLYSFGE